MTLPQDLVALPREVRERLSRELREVRADAVARYTEVDLLVAALRDHIRDLQAERDYLRQELARVRAELVRSHEAVRLASTPWMRRGLKGPRIRG